MRRFLIVFTVLMLAVSFSGCGSGKENLTDNSTSDFSVILPADDTVNGYKINTEGKNYSLTEGKEAVSSENSEADFQSFYVNVKTKKLHKTSCVYAKKGVESGELVNKTRDELINEGYSPCQKCNP